MTRLPRLRFVAVVAALLLSLGLLASSASAKPPTRQPRSAVLTPSPATEHPQRASAA